MKARAVVVGLVMAAVLVSVGGLAQDKKGLEKKLAQTVIDHVAFEEATLPAVVAFLKQKSKELDPQREGVNIILMLPQGEGGQELKLPLVTMEFDDMPLGELIRYLCMAADCQYKIEAHAVIIAHKSQAMNTMETRTFKVAPGTAQAIVPAEKRPPGEGGETGIDDGVQWPTKK